MYNPFFEKKIGREHIHAFLYDLIQCNPERFQPTGILHRLLSLPYFPFVITTTFDTIVENTMKEIYGERLRIKSFVNNPSLNEDIENPSDITRPTLYYMFGKANPEPWNRRYVVSDIDYLRFARAWLSPTDCESKTKPYNLSQALSEKYLLVIGSDYQDWMFRFIWYALKEDRLINANYSTGALTGANQDEQLIEFLAHSNTFSHIDDPNNFVNHLCESLEEATKVDTEIIFKQPINSCDVFLSYSRADSTTVESLYNILTSKGVKVWYDKENLGAGVDFMAKIRTSIQKSTLFVPVLSRAIAAQINDMHPYREEWKYAIHKKNLIGGITYIVPFCEKEFESHLNDERVNIPAEMTAHNVRTFSSTSIMTDIEGFATEIIQILKDEYGITI